MCTSTVEGVAGGQMKLLVVALGAVRLLFHLLCLTCSCNCASTIVLGNRAA